MQKRAVNAGKKVECWSILTLKYFQGSCIDNTNTVYVDVAPVMNTGKYHFFSGEFWKKINLSREVSWEEDVRNNISGKITVSIGKYGEIEIIYKWTAFKHKKLSQQQTW